MFRSGNKQLSQCHNITDRLEVDLVFKILKIIDTDEYSQELRIKDLSLDSYPWSLSINKLKFTEPFKEGEVCKVSKAMIEALGADKRLVITCKQNTNFLRFHPDTYLYRDLRITIKEDKNEDEEEHLYMEPKYVTRVLTEDEQMTEA